MLGAQPCMQTAGNNTTQREGYIERETYIFIYILKEKSIFPVGQDVSLSGMIPVNPLTFPPLTAK
jgi:hypothetical protein